MDTPHESSIFLFERVPMVLFNQIQDFLIPSDYYKLITMAKRFFQEIKKDTWRITIKQSNVEESMKLKKKRQRVFRIIRNHKTQLKLLNYNALDQTQLHELLLQDAQTMIADSTFLHEVPNWIQLMSNHSNLRFIRENHHITSFEGIRKEKGENISRLYLYSFHVLTDVSHLKYLQNLVLDKCPSLMDVNCLEGIRKLTIRNCQNVMDVSRLGHIYSLTLHHCNSLLDISSLSYNYSLTIFSCQNISRSTLNFHHIKKLSCDLLDSNDILLSANCLELQSLISTATMKDPVFQIPITVKCIELSYTMSVQLHTFSHCRKVVLRRFQSVDFAPLFNVPFVELQESSQQQTCSGLGGNKFVCLDTLPNMRDYSALRTVPCIRLINMNGRENFLRDNFGHCHELSIISCDGIKNLEGLGDVKELTCLDCPLNTLNGLGSANNKIIIDKAFEEKVKKGKDSLFWNEFYTIEKLYEIERAIVLLRKK